MSHNLMDCMNSLEQLSSWANGPRRKELLDRISVKDCYFEAMREIIIAIKSKKLNVRYDLKRCRKKMREFQSKHLNRHKKASLVKKIGNGIFLGVVIPYVKWDIYYESLKKK